MLNLICLISHYDSDSAKATTKNLIGFNDTKSLRSVAARRVRCVVVGEYARHNKLNLPLAQLFNFRIGFLMRKSGKNAEQQASELALAKLGIKEVTEI